MKRLASWIMILALLIGSNAYASEADSGAIGDWFPVAGNCDSFGSDKDKFLDNYSIYSEAYQQKDFDRAYAGWKYVYKNGPGFHPFVHSSGLKIMKHYAKKAESDSVKRLYLDSMLVIYDKQAECFPDRSPGYYMEMRALDMLRYKSEDTDGIFALLEEGQKVNGYKTGYYVLSPWFTFKVRKYMKKEMSREDMMAAYEYVVNITDSNKTSKYADKYQNVLDKSTKIMDDKLKLLGCANLVPHYTKKFAEEPENMELAAKAWKWIYKCSFNDTTFAMFDKYYNATKNFDVVPKLAQEYLKRDNLEKALELLEVMADNAPDSSGKAEAYMNMAKLMYQQKKFGEARKYARKVSEFDPTSGEPYILIGTLYASSGKRCGSGTGWDSQVVAWPAIDMWQKAKALDPSVADKAQEKISKYWGYMPTKEDIFQRGLSVGGSYTVGCWIGASTTIRASN